MTLLTILGLAALYAAGVFTGLSAPKIIAWAKAKRDQAKARL